MTLKDYHVMALEGAIAKGDYENEDIRTHGLIEKWKMFYLVELRTLQNSGRQMKALIHQRSQYYLGKTAIPYEMVVLKSELPRYLDADPEIQSLAEEIDMRAAVTDYCKEMVENFKRRGFEIKGAREWFIWSAGGNV
jgi:hypothetical protein